MCRRAGHTAEDHHGAAVCSRRYVGAKIGGDLAEALAPARSVTHAWLGVPGRRPDRLPCGRKGTAIRSAWPLHSPGPPSKAGVSILLGVRVLASVDAYQLWSCWLNRRSGAAQ